MIAERIKDDSKISTNGKSTAEIKIAEGVETVKAKPILTSLWESLSRDPLSTLFFGLYIMIAIATFRHTMIGFASIEEGNLFWGAMAALAIDAGLMLSATGLRKKRHPVAFVALIFGLVVSVLASAYAQLLYSVMHAQAVEVAPGAVWLGNTATWIIEKRVVIMSALLPFLAVGYSFAAKTIEDDNSNWAVSHIAGGTYTNLDNKKRKRKGTVKDSCKDAWLEHGLDQTAAYIADLVGCHFTTANKARQELIEEQA